VPSRSYQLVELSKTNRNKFINTFQQEILANIGASSSSSSSWQPPGPRGPRDPAVVAAEAAVIERQAAREQAKKTRMAHKVLNMWAASLQNGCEHLAFVEAGQGHVVVDDEISLVSLSDLMPDGTLAPEGVQGSCRIVAVCWSSISKHSGLHS